MNNKEGRFPNRPQGKAGDLEIAAPSSLRIA
jgi:hypothetical protein